MRLIEIITGESVGNIQSKINSFIRNNDVVKIGEIQVDYSFNYNNDYMLGIGYFCKLEYIDENG